jgi:hypothetical protein
MRTRILTAVSMIALSTLAIGCTYGTVVDTRFNPVRTDAWITFVGLDDNLRENNHNHTFKMNNQSFVSFDSYAADGATNSQLPGLSNVSEQIQPGAYYVLYVAGGPPIRKSVNFLHTYEGNCTDFFTGAQDRLCEQYYFQIDDTCTACGGSRCPGPVPLPTRPSDGVKIIKLCT